MTTKIHRQIGKFQKRSADEASVAMIIKEVSDTDVLLGKLVEHTKAWRDAWTDILVVGTRLDDSFHDIYGTIPRTGDTAIPPPETSQSIMRRVAMLHTTHNDLKADMMEEVDKIDRLLIEPFKDCRAFLKPVKKAIEKREGKKLDFERFQKQVEHSKAKKNKSDREYSVQSRAEADLERATTAYDIADNHLKEWVPPIIAKIVDYLPLAVEIYVQIQFTLFQHTYSALYQYAQEHGYSDPDGDEVIAEWRELFEPVQAEVEQGLNLIAKGKAILRPMNYIPEEKTYVPSVPKLGRNKAPPPPPAGNSARAVSPARSMESYERPTLGRSKSSTYLNPNQREESPPPVPTGRPSIGSVRARSPASSAYGRDESPPPPLPGPRPSAEIEQPSFRSRPSFGSYGGSGGGSVTPTPLAGLQPSSLSLSSARSVDGTSPVDARSIDTARSVFSNGEERPNGARIGSRSNVPPIGGVRLQSAPSVIPDRSPSQSSMSTLSSIAGKKKPPPPPPKKKNIGGPKETWVTALYSFEGQDRGDLSFSEGQKIKVLKKTDNTDDWWEGEVDGRKGQFPANYCE